MSLLFNMLPRLVITFLPRSKHLPETLFWIQPVHPKGDQSWIFIGRTNAEAETPILWPPDAKNWLIWKDPNAGKDSRQEKKGTTEDEMVGWHHQLSGHEFEQALGVGDGQGSVACCSPWGCKELDTTEWLNWTECAHVNLKLLRYLFPSFFPRGNHKFTSTTVICYYYHSHYCFYC